MMGKVTIILIGCGEFWDDNCLEVGRSALNITSIVSYIKNRG